MALLVAHRQPIAWPVLIGLLLMLLVAVSGQVAGKGVAVLTSGTAVSTAVEIDAAEALLVEGKGWKTVATVAAIGAVVLGGIAFSVGMGVAVAAAAGSLSAKAGLTGAAAMVGGVTGIGQGLQALEELYKKK
ncbi:MAG: hypothetical protein DIU55_006145 [Bacillota bacterium]|nr:MAG: hypothetical protein DIU55_10765 [Bacillota bacterium]